MDEQLYVDQNVFFELPDDSETIARVVEAIPPDWQWMEGGLCSRLEEGGEFASFTHEDRQSVFLDDEKRRAARLIREGCRGCLTAFYSQNGTSRWQNPARCIIEFPFTHRSHQRHRYIMIARNRVSAHLTESLITSCRTLGLQEYLPEFQPSSETISVESMF